MSTRTSEERICNLISMAQRAGKMASGAFAVEKSLQEGSVHYLLIAEDAAAETTRKYKELAEKYHVPYGRILVKSTLGHSLGKEYRSVAGVLDEGFAKRVHSILEERMKE